jgi:hypothetical protein
MKRPLYILRWIESRFHCIPNYCHRCGRWAEPFVVEDETWRAVTGNADPLCLSCYHKMEEK